MAGRAKIRYACGHEGYLHSFGRGAMREKHMQWAKGPGLCPKCRLERLAVEAPGASELEKARRDNEISLMAGAPASPRKRSTSFPRPGRRQAVQAMRCEKKRARHGARGR